MILVSCGEDRRLEYVGLTTPNKAIESVMRQNYYWYEDIPESKSLNYFTTPHGDFFKSLLSKQDLNYSYFEDPADIESLRSYGIEFETSITFNNDTAHAVRVLYVDSDSPADDAGLMRGDWIIKRNDRFIVKSRIDSLYKGSAIKLTLGEYAPFENENGQIVNDFKEKETIQLGAARPTSDNPIHYSGMYTTPNSRIGYLFYSNFTSGKDDNDETYDNALRTASNWFYSQGINEFILDLRYNTGGNLKSAQLLGSILVPQKALGSPMCYLKYNELQSSQKEEWLFSQEILGSGSNLNLEKLYVITGSITAATSDVLINALKPYIDEIILIGQTTKGNHTGTHPYEHEEFSPYILHPVDCMIYNSKDELPTGGLAPTHAFNELTYESLPIGNQKEVLLSLTLGLIEEGSVPTEEDDKEEGETRSVYMKKVPGFNTLNNKPIRGTSIR